MDAAASHGIPLRTIVAAVAVAAAAYMLGVLAYRLRGVLLLILLGSFAALSRPALRLGEGVASLFFALFTTFALTFLFLLEAPKLRSGFLSLMAPAKAERYARVMREMSRSVSGYMLGNLLTSLIAGLSS